MIAYISFLFFQLAFGEPLFYQCFDKSFENRARGAEIVINVEVVTDHRSPTSVRRSMQSILSQANRVFDGIGVRFQLRSLRPTSVTPATRTQTQFKSLWQRQTAFARHRGSLAVVVGDLTGYYRQSNGVFAGMSIGGVGNLVC